MGAVEVNVATAYWDRGEAHVPFMTGAMQLLDAADVPVLASRLGLELPLRDVLDVGCGTGRLAKHCSGYQGVDIAPSAVAYCLTRGIAAQLIDDPVDLPAGPFGLVTCLSVFTHIDRATRQAYLSAFAERSTDVLVDIIPGDGRGDFARWTAVEDEFLADVQAAGFAVVAEASQISPVSAEHGYFRLRRLA